MKDFLKKFLLFFIIINTGVFFVVGISSVGYTDMRVDTIWKVFLVSAATALVTAIVFSIEPKKKVTRLANLLIFMAHFLSLSAIVFFGGTKFGWFDYSIKGFLNVLISVFIVYALTAVTYIILINKETKELNDALMNYTKKEAD